MKRLVTLLLLLTTGAQAADGGTPEFILDVDGGVLPLEAVEVKMAAGIAKSGEPFAVTGGAWWSKGYLIHQGRQFADLRGQNASLAEAQKTGPSASWLAASLAIGVLLGVLAGFYLAWTLKP